MKFHAVIPARSGSKSVIDKNIKDFGGHPVLSYSIAVANMSELIDRCIVTTDSTSYANIAKPYGAEIVMRPAFLSSDIASDIDYLLHLIFTLNLNVDDCIVLLRPTTPLREVEIVNNAVEMFTHNHNRFDSLRSLHKLNESPEKMYKFSCFEESGISDIDIEPYMKIPGLICC